MIAWQSPHFLAWQRRNPYISPYCSFLTLLPVFHPHLTLTYWMVVLRHMILLHPLPCLCTLFPLFEIPSSSLPYTYQVNSQLSVTETLNITLFKKPFPFQVRWDALPSYFCRTLPLRHQQIAENTCMAGGLDHLRQQLPPTSIRIPVNPHLLTVRWPGDLLLINGIQQRGWTVTTAIKVHKTVPPSY